MNMLNRILLSLSLLVGFSVTAHAAGSAVNGKIKEIAIDRIYTTNRVFVSIIGGKSSFPECHTNTSWSYALPLDNDIDKAIFSMLLSAQASGKSVILEGRGQCDVHSSMETLSYIKYGQ